MLEFHALVVAAFLIFLVKVVFGAALKYRSRTTHVPSPVVIVVVGPSHSGKTLLCQALQEKLANSQRPFIYVNSNELFGRLPRTIFPDIDSSASPNVGDPMFHAWTYVKQPDGAMNLVLADRGVRCMHGLHRSWSCFVQSGCNLLIEYCVTDESLLNDLFSVLRSVLGRKLERLVIVDLRGPISDLIRREADTNKTAGIHPTGFALSTFKLSRNLRSFPTYATRILIDVAPGTTAEEVADKTYRSVYRTRLL